LCPAGSQQGKNGAKEMGAPPSIARQHLSSEQGEFTSEISLTDCFPALTRTPKKKGTKKPLRCCFHLLPFCIDNLHTPLADERFATFPSLAATHTQTVSHNAFFVVVLTDCTIPELGKQIVLFWLLLGSFGSSRGKGGLWRAGRFPFRLFFYFMMGKPGGSMA